MVNLRDSMGIFCYVLQKKDVLEVNQKRYEKRKRWGPTTCQIQEAKVLRKKVKLQGT